MIRSSTLAALGSRSTSVFAHAPGDESLPKQLSQRQLICIQSLWARRMGAAGIAGDDERRELRHAYIREITSGRAGETRALTFADAQRVIRRLIADQSPSPQIKDREAARAAGRHGRRRHDDRGQSMMVSAAQLELLAGYADRLGWTRERLDAFIERQLGHGRRVRTVAQANKVLWGLKSMVRRADATAAAGQAQA